MVLDDLDGNLEVLAHLDPPRLGVVGKAGAAQLLVPGPCVLVHDEVQASAHDHRELRGVGREARAAEEAGSRDAVDSGEPVDDEIHELRRGLRHVAVPALNA
ncbi:hypothetical protein D9M69_639910 [compost metagenome]